MSRLKTILIVDFDTRWEINLEQLLNRLGYNAFTVTSGVEGLDEILRVFKPEMILLDLRLPILNGVACIEKIRREKAFDRISVVLVSDAGDKDVLSNALERGAQAYLFKPLNPTELYKTIHRLIEPHARQFLRLRTVLKVVMTFGLMTRQLYTSTISEQGMFLRTRNPLPVGSNIKLWFEFPLTNGIEVNAEVMHEIKADRDAYTASGMGVYFTKISHADRQEIRKFVESELVYEMTGIFSGDE
ncbi:MAG: response regulator [Deltaproteobacteria bacterium]|nr:response regulator [Deltaproteobacteria bacterium]